MNIEFDLFIDEAIDILNKGENDYLSAVLYIEYDGILHQHYKGFYVHSFQHNDITIHNALTHFETTYARLFFPCFDEPHFKANFIMKVYAPMTATVLSNTLPQSSEKVNGKSDCNWKSHLGHISQCKLVTFMATPKMSTYLVMLAIGDYEYVSGKSGHISQRIYFPIKNHYRAKFALKTSLAIMPFYERIFHMKYKLPKLYSLAVGHDFVVKAMEQWGMITYDDNSLLVDSSQSTLMRKMKVAMTIAHEESHQWFGNLVTIKWWNHIWLDEGFAEYFQYIGAAHAHPDMKNIPDLFYYNTHKIMLRDCSLDTHALLENEVTSILDIRAIFDRITYGKGSAVLHTIIEYIGRRNFMQAIRIYLDRYQFANVVTHDLFHILAEYTVKHDEHFSNSAAIIDMMNTWVLNTGIPIVSVSLHKIGYSKIRLYLEQNRMFPKFHSQLSNDVWHIPLRIRNCLRTYDNKQLFNGNIEITIGREYCLDNIEYYIINPEMKSYFRTYYDRKSLELIVSSFHKLSKIDQFNVVSDRFALLKFDYISVDDYLSFISAIVDKIFHGDEMESVINVNYLLWRLIIHSFEYIDDIYCEFFSSEDMRTQLLSKDFRFYARNIIHKIWDAIGKWDGNGSINYAQRIVTDSNDNVLLRSLIIFALVRFEDHDIIDEGYNLLVDNMYDDEHHFHLTKDGYFDGNIDVNILQSIFEAGLSKMDNDQIRSCTNARLIYYNLVRVYDHANAELKSFISKAIDAVYRDSHMLQHSVDFLLSSEMKTNSVEDGVMDDYYCERIY